MKYKKGDIVRVVDEFNGHKLQIGDIVEVVILFISHNCYEVVGENGSWLVRGNEIEPID